MSTLSGACYRSGVLCASAGRFEFDRYANGERWPAPSPAETTVELRAGEPFPRIGSTGGECWWRGPAPVDPAHAAAKDMISEGGRTESLKGSDA